MDQYLHDRYGDVPEQYYPILEEYCGNDSKKLRNLVDTVVFRTQGGLDGKDMDAFYSTANDVMADIVRKKRYDKSKGDFNGFLYQSLVLAFIDDHKYNTRDRRTAKIKVTDEDTGKIKKVPVQDVYMDAPIGEDEGITFGDMLSSDFNIETSLSQTMGVFHENVENYLNSLSGTQQQIARLLMKGFSKGEIKETLGLTDKQYRAYWQEMTSYDNKRLLYTTNYDTEDDDMDTVHRPNVSERYKDTHYSIESIVKQLHKKRIKDNHILQRHSGRWLGFAKSALVSDILHGKSLTQVIIDEEIRDGVRMQWLIDGKQRCTTLDDFLNDGFAISKNIKNPVIPYQATKLNADGDVVLNAEGFEVTEVREFDIRGKKFSQLPEELQDIFKDRQIPVLYNMNCTKQDIADDITRFNRSRPMNKAENGWLGLDEYFAEFVEKIAATEFFQTDFKGSSYTKNNHDSGTIRRIIVEGIVVADFIDDYTKSFDKMCEFLTDEASDDNFTDFYFIVDRLIQVGNDKVAHMFNARDSHIWFGLFSRFINTGLDDERFIDFMVEFDKSLHSKEVDGVSYDSINGRNTKDKNAIKRKMELLEKLMCEYLKIEHKDTDNVDTLEFITENVDSNATEEDIPLYEAMLDDCLKVDNPINTARNRPSLLALVAYGVKHDKDEEVQSWFGDVGSRAGTYLLNQKQNYDSMLDSLTKYVEEQTRKTA